MNEKELSTGKIEVYHTGYQIIPTPDVKFGRVNADFGQGFYVTPNKEFAYRWAKVSRDKKPIVNKYMLNLEGLKIHRFSRSIDWFRYIFQNRRGRADELDADIVIGPIANDTIYDTLGILTSGFLSDELALKCFQAGGEYIQIALKTRAAQEHLEFISSEVLDEGKIRQSMEILTREQDDYLKQIAEIMEENS